MKTTAPVFSAMCVWISFSTMFVYGQQQYRQRIGEIGSDGSSKYRYYNVPSTRTWGEIKSEIEVRKERIAKAQRDLKEKNGDLQELKQQIEMHSRQLEKANSEYERKLKIYEDLNESDNLRMFRERAGEVSETSDIYNFYSEAQKTYFYRNGEKNYGELERFRDNLNSDRIQLRSSAESIRSNLERENQVREEYQKEWSSAIKDAESLETLITKTIRPLPGLEGFSNEDPSLTTPDIPGTAKVTNNNKPPESMQELPINNDTTENYSPEMVNKTNEFINRLRKLNRPEINENKKYTITFTTEGNNDNYFTKTLTFDSYKEAEETWDTIVMEHRIFGTASDAKLLDPDGNLVNDMSGISSDTRWKKGQSGRHAD